MRKLFFIFFGILFLSTQNSQAQREVIEYQQDYDNNQWYFGFYLGVNQNDFKISYKTPNTYIESDPSTGFLVGIIGSLKLHKNISLRFEPGLTSNTKKLYFHNIATKKDSVRKVGGTYLHLPLLLKFNTNRLGNMRPYIIGGASYDYNFSSNQDNPDDNFNGEFRMLKNNFMYEFGIGVDLYLPYFVFSPSIRGVFAINNELKYDNDTNSQWTAPVDFLGTRGVFLKLSFH